MRALIRTILEIKKRSVMGRQEKDGLARRWDERVRLTLIRPICLVHRPGVT